MQWRALSVRLGDSEPLLNRWHIEQVSWDQPRVWLERERDGQLALVKALTPKPASTHEAVAVGRRLPVRHRAPVRKPALAPAFVCNWRSS